MSRTRSFRSTRARSKPVPPATKSRKPSLARKRSFSLVPVQTVSAGTAPEDVVPLLPAYEVRSRSAIEVIVPGASRDVVRAPAAVDHVIAESTVARGYSPIVYQHFPRIAREPFLRTRCEEIGRTLRLPAWALFTGRVAFIVIAQPHHRARLLRATDQASGTAGMRRFVEPQVLAKAAPPHGTSAGFHARHGRT
jgi:hypothetical protein